MERKILYQLKTKDGIKSEIREADHFMPDIRLATKPQISAISYAEVMGRFQTIEERRYRMRRHSTVEFVEYEEE